MNIAENFHRTVVPSMFANVRKLWPLYHPERIADELNATYSLWGKEALDGRAICNMRQRIAAIDRAAGRD